MDIGKTKTFAVLLSRDLEITARCVAGPADIILGRERVVGALQQVINECVLGRGLSINDLDVISISWAGLDTERMRGRARGVVRELGLPAEKTVIEHDAVAALYTVTWGRPGIAVIAGTGAIAFGIDGEGRRARSSGWGWVIGDEGGAYWIAQKALNAASRAYDGRGRYTSLVDRLKQYYGVRDLLEIMDVVYSRECVTPGEIAKLSRLVDEEARKGDEVAREIMVGAGRELAAAAISVARKLNVIDKKVLVGGVGNVFNSQIVREVFKEEVKRGIPRAVVLEPVIGYKAVVGPVIIALKKLGVALSKRDVVKRIEELMDEL